MRESEIDVAVLVRVGDAGTESRAWDLFRCFSGRVFL